MSAFSLARTSARSLLSTRLSISRSSSSRTDSAGSRDLPAPIAQGLPRAQTDREENAGSSYQGSGLRKFSAESLHFQQESGFRAEDAGYKWGTRRTGACSLILFLFCSISKDATSHSRHRVLAKENGIYPDLFDNCTVKWMIFARPRVWTTRATRLPPHGSRRICDCRKCA